MIVCRIFWLLRKATEHSHAFSCICSHTHTCGSMGRWMGGVRAGCMPPLLKDSERGGREGSETRLDTLCCSAGELCLFSLERSSTWDRVTYRRHSQPSTHCHTPPRATVQGGKATTPQHAHPLNPPLPPLQSTRQSHLPSTGEICTTEAIWTSAETNFAMIQFKKKNVECTFIPLPPPPSFFVCACLP